MDRVRVGDLRLFGTTTWVVIRHYATGEWVVGRLRADGTAIPEETRRRDTLEDWPLVARRKLRRRTDVYASAVEVVR